LKLIQEKFYYLILAKFYFQCGAPVVCSGLSMAHTSIELSVCRRSS
jgi:hypothetical protein